MILVLIAAFGLLAMLLAGCGVTTGAKIVPTATPLPQLRLDWRPMNMPPQASVTPYTLGFAPSDGDVVYACNVDARASSQQLHLWVTRDRSAHWTHLTDLTVHAGSNRCILTVDEWRPDIAVVAIDWAPMGASPGLSSFASYVTLDGGASWRQLSGPNPYAVRELATIATFTYAIIAVDAPGGEPDELASSSDGLRTWQPLPQTQSFGLDGGSSGFWLDPKNGALLVEASLPTGAGLWRSDDGGMHWTALSTPVSPSDLSLAQVVVQSQAGAWHICIITSPGNGSTPSSSITCSLDGGQTWQQRPGLNVAFTNPSKGTFYAPTDVFALDDSDAILAGVSLEDFTDFSLHETFYRLAPQARQWQVIGSVEGADFPVGLYPSATGDVLWASGLDQGWFFASYP